MRKKDAKGFASKAGGDFVKGDRVEVEGKGAGTFVRWTAAGDAVVTLDADGDEYKLFAGKVKPAPQSN